MALGAPFDLKRSADNRETKSSNRLGTAIIMLVEKAREDYILKRSSVH